MTRLGKADMGLKASEMIIGIDIGVQGAVAVLDQSGALVEVHDMPTLQDGPAGRARSMLRCSLRSSSLRAQATEVEVSLQMRETPEQLLKWLSSGIPRRRLYKRRHNPCIQ